VRSPRTVSALASLAVVCAGLGAVSAPVVAGGPVTVHYPSASEGCPLDDTAGLQDCIDSVEAGSTVILTQEINGDNDALIKKSLTLKASNPSLHPVLAGISIQANEFTPPVLDVTVQDIHVQAVVMINFEDGSGHKVLLRRLEVGKGEPDPQGISVSTSVPASVTIESSYIRATSSGAALGLYATDPDGDVRFRVIGNRITQHGGIGTAEGIRLDMDGDGNVRADIYNNSIWDVASCDCGTASGIAINPGGPIHGDVNVVGNTIDKTPSFAIDQRNLLTAGGHLALDIFDNIISHHQRNSFSIEAGPRLTFRAGYNDYHANTVESSYLDGQSLGSGNRHDDPRFVDRAAGNLKLKASSPLIDKGLVCSPGGVANLDPAGHGRLSGPRVDMGAYEYGAGTPSGVARVGTSGANTLNGTSGDDILCGYAGNDTLKGKGGRDYLDGGSDADKVTGGSGPDRSYGGSGADTLCSSDGVHGNDRADGGSGTDKGRADSGDTKVSIEGSAAC
jgi:hypothetical protein